MDCHSREGACENIGGSRHSQLSWPGLIGPSIMTLRDPNVLDPAFDGIKSWI